MIDRLGRRLALGLALAALLSGALAWWLSREARVGGAIAAPPRADAPRFELPSTVPAGVAFVLYVGAPHAVLPDRVAPVAAIAANGSVRIVRAAPVAESPEPEPWIAAGITLPGARLAALTPSARAALLALLGRWRGTLGVGTPWRAVTVGVEDPGELAVLGRWER